MGLRQIYLEEIHKSLGYRANWLPGRPVRVGDVGMLLDGVFERMTSLSELGIAFDIRRDTSPKTFSYRSEGRITVETKISGRVSSSAQGLGEADAGLIIACNSSSGVLLEAAESRIESIEDLDAVGVSVMTQFKGGTWPRERVVVNELVRSGRTTAIGLETENGRLELRAAAGEADLDPASLSASFAMAYEQAVGLKVIAEKGLCPLYRLAGISRRPIRSRFGPNRLDESMNERGESVEADLDDAFVELHR